MKTLKRISKKAAVFCELSGINLDGLKYQINCGQLQIKRCETKEEMDLNGVDYSYPYVISNPYELSLKHI